MDICKIKLHMYGNLIIRLNFQDNKYILFI